MFVKDLIYYLEGCNENVEININNYSDVEFVYFDKDNNTILLSSYNLPGNEENLVLF